SLLPGGMGTRFQALRPLPATRSVQPAGLVSRALLPSFGSPAADGPQGAAANSVTPRSHPRTPLGGPSGAGPPRPEGLRADRATGNTPLMVRHRPPGGYRKPESWVGVDRAAPSPSAGRMIRGGDPGAGRRGDGQLACRGRH